MTTTVWAFKRLAALKGEVGFVECDDALAAQLIAAGDAEDPRDGATALTHIDHTPLAATPADEQTYDDKAMKSKRRKSKDD